MDQQPGSSFMDSRTILAVILVGALWIFWQAHLEKKYPEAFKPPQTSPQTATTKSENPTAVVKLPSTYKTQQELAPTEQTVFIPFSDQKWKFEVSSAGMGIQNLILNTYTDRAGQPVSLGMEKIPIFETRVKGANLPLPFHMEQVSSNEFRGTAKVGSATITKTVAVHSDTYTFDSEVLVDGADGSFPGIESVVTEKIKPMQSGGLFAPPLESNEVYVSYGTSEERTTLKKDNYSKSFSNVSIASVGSHYFAIALLDQSEVMPSASVDAHNETQTMTGTLSYPNLGGSGKMKITYRGFAGPKSLSLLTSIDHRMSRLINFGMFAWIARPLLILMKLLYAWVHNYGLAIIILTFSVRLLVLPINMMSYRSMKAMSAIQPQLKALNEKYKHDPKTRNLEQMALFKQHKVNPLGSCLPMLLQLPVFFALYRVLGQSIELYKAPFFFWIHDLSVKDPYYILPAIFGVGTFLQQKITPTSMDPAQAKMMTYMPIIFALFMFGLPSGLTLYMCVTTIFGITQQYIFMRERRTLTASAAAKA